MASRSDIVDGRLAETERSGVVYTRKCGWVDLGHARPTGAKDLWDMIHHERGRTVNMDVTKSVGKNKLTTDKPQSYVVISRVYI